MINLFHVRIFLDHRVKSRWAMWPVIFFSSYFLFDSRWMRKRRKLDCIFFPTDSFQGPSFGYCWWRFRCFKQKQQKGTSFKLSKMLISLKTKIYISIMTMSRHINKKKPCTFFERLMLAKFCHHLLDNNIFKQLNAFLDV